MQNLLLSIEEEAKKEILQAENIKELQQLRVKYLGKKGKVTVILKKIGELPPQERPEIGKLANKLKNQINLKLQKKIEEIKKNLEDEKLTTESLDVTMPGKHFLLGNLHPLTQISREIKNIFIGLGFEVALGPEIETDYFNFEALNIPYDHPAREMWDSFYIGYELLLRTHTSPVQIRVMEKYRPPLRVISLGKCYRRDAVDATHCFQFHQLEGFMVDKNVTFGNLKGVLTSFACEMFGTSRKVRFLPSYFPFTEPSAELLIDCYLCQQQNKECHLCGGSGWLEILGAGMIHPFVMRVVEYDPEKFSGFAFGMGIERIAMIKYGIDDIRLFFENNMRFLKQF